MKLIKTKFEETYIIKNQKIKDERGFFMRGFCESVFLKTGVKFKIKVTSGSTYKYMASKDGDLGCIVDGVTHFHECNVSYIGRTKVKGYTFVMGKKMNVELNLKTLKFVK